MVSSLYEIVAHQVRAQGWLRRTMFILAAFGAIFAGLMSMREKPDEGYEVWVLVVHAVGLLFAGIVPILFTFAEKTPEELIRELGKQTEKRNEAEDIQSRVESERDAISAAYRSSIALYYISRAISETTDAVLLADGDLRRDVARRQLYSILDRLIEHKSGLFGMGDDRWTFGVYVLEDDLLKLPVTRRWSRDNENGNHRVWTPGEGHVGQAFRARRELVCADSRAPDVAGFMEATGDNAREYDSELYVSFASLPLMIGGRDEPLGVLVATSDQSGRFTPSNGDGESMDTVEPLRLAANVIATILCLTEDDGSWFPEQKGDKNAGS